MVRIDCRGVSAIVVAHPLLAGVRRLVGEGGKDPDVPWKSPHCRAHGTLHKDSDKKSEAIKFIQAERGEVWLENIKNCQSS